MPSRGVTVSRLGAADRGWAVGALVDAFAGQAPITSLFREPHAARKLRYFMECSWRYALLFGECYGSREQGGVALWLVPGATRMTPARMFRAGMFSAPLRMGLRDFKAFGAFAGHTDRVHRAAVPEPHYYLLALGVRPDSQGSGIGGELTQSMIERADGEGVSIYLETQTERTAVYYTRFGFEVASRDAIAPLGLTNWGMVRRPGS